MLLSFDSWSGLDRRLCLATFFGSTLLACGGHAPEKILDEEDPPPEKEVDPIPEKEEVPEFGGVKLAVVESQDDIHLTWDAARDDATSPAQIVYRIYLGETIAGQDLPVSIARPFATTLPGVTSHWFHDMPAGRYRFVVRAVDRDGNEDDNRNSVVAVVGDGEPPSFEGVFGARFTTSRDLVVEWSAASDNVTPSELIQYEIYVGKAADTLFEQDPLFPPQGATSHRLEVGAELLSKEGQQPRDIWVGVRARDEAGNREKNQRSTSARSLENDPPTFAGLDQVAPHELGVELTWKRAEDTNTPQADIVYYIYQSTKSGAHNYLEPSMITQPGISRYVVTDLLPETKYFFVVQAVDQAGNRDGNHEERAFITREADETPPVFAGVQQVSSTTPSSATFAWDAASDDRSGSENIAFEIYLADKSKTQDFEAEPAAISPPGRNSWTVFGLSPDTKYFVIVRARDQAQNLEDNDTELSFSTRERQKDDEESPMLMGDLSVRYVPSRPDWLQVGWAGATDDGSKVRGHVCVAPDADECKGEAFFESLNSSSTFGASSIVVDGLKSRTTYRVAVRLEDENGNLSSEIFSRGTTSTSYQADVLPILERRCNECHDYRYGAILNVPSSFEALPLVRPDSPEQSYLFRTLRASGDTQAPFSEDTPATYTGKRMPSDGTPYFDSDLERVFLDWISQGAFEN